MKLRIYFLSLVALSASFAGQLSHARTSTSQESPQNLLLVVNVCNQSGRWNGAACLDKSEVKELLRKYVQALRESGLLPNVKIVGSNECMGWCGKLPFYFAEAPSSKPNGRPNFSKLLNDRMYAKI